VAISFFRMIEISIAKSVPFGYIYAMEEAAPRPDLSDIVGVPVGYLVSLEAGWPTISDIFRLGTKSAIVRYRNISLPQAFQITIAPEPHHGEPVEWVAVLLFSVDSDTDRIDLKGVFASGIDADQAVNRVMKVRPAPMWTQWALLRFALDDLPADLSADQVREAWAQLEDIGSYRTKRGRDRITDQTLERVAEVYRAAWKAGANPTEAVATEFNKARSTAARYVGLARRKGKLGPSDGSRGGELPTQTNPK
jgi:hypothetical protein